MSAFSKAGAFDRAITIVTSALQAGAIKLDGASSAGYNAEQLKADADYLNGLINSLAANLTEN
jgi:hypothetical protein